MIDQNSHVATQHVRTGQFRILNMDKRTSLEIFFDWKNCQNLRFKCQNRSILPFNQCSLFHYRFVFLENIDLVVKNPIHDTYSWSS